MIVGLDGIVEKKEPTFLHVNVNGIIYEVNISVNCSNSISSDKIKLHITQIVREDGSFLYGFMNIDEKVMFDTIIKINGVGPKVALAICSTYSPTSFAQIVSNSDLTSLKKVPGIGPKSASRLLVELSGFSTKLVNSDELKPQNRAYQEALSALESLGFKKMQVEKIISNVSIDNTSELVKYALKQLQK
jgi:Holliday junction DNA helicase RuvA